MTARYAFFLGGHDLEMETIKRLLTTRCGDAVVYDKGLGWGAKATDYANEIKRERRNGRRVVLIELITGIHSEDDSIIIDHHNERAGHSRPTSLEQVFDLLNLDRSKDWSRTFDLVSANDRGHISGMLALDPPASESETEAIRRADRAAQGVTEQEERMAIEAISNAARLGGGKLTVVRCPHDRASVVADIIDSRLGGAGFENLLVMGPAEVDFFGTGTVVSWLAANHEGSWFGGDLPERGFWGAKRDVLQEDDSDERLIGSVVDHLSGRHR